MEADRPPIEEPEGSIPKILETESIGFIAGKGWFRFAPDGTATPMDDPPDEVLGKPLMDILRERKHNESV